LFEWLDAPVIRVASIDAPVPFAPQMEDYFLPQVSEIVGAAFGELLKFTPKIF